MLIVIPADGRVMALMRATALRARRLDDNLYALTGDNFRMSDVSREQALIFPDEAVIAEGDLITDEIVERALSIDNFLTPSLAEAAADALGLVLRAAVADGRVSDGELLRVAPALEGRLWQPGIAVVAGDVYTFGAFLWKCVQPHTTQSDWTPDLTPALWRKVEIILEEEPRVWAASVGYIVGDTVAFPDANAARYECVQAHTSLPGWEPPNVPALWRAI